MRRALVLCALLLCSCQPQHSEQEPLAASQPPAAAAVCGDKGQPDCPLQGWMKSTMQPYLHDKQLDRLALSFDKLAQHAPEGYPSWKDLAEAGAQAARNQDEPAVRKACKTCHDQHRAKFRKQRRSLPLF